MRVSIVLFSIASLATAADVHNVTWGMTRQQVIAAEGTPVETRPASLSYGTVSLAGLHAHLTYYFENGQLVRATYLFTTSHDDPDQYIRDFQLVEPLLRERHGAPILDRAYWEDDDDQAERAGYLNQDRATPADLLPSDPFVGKTLLAGHVKLRVEWEHERTRILHGLAALGRRVVHEVEYRAR